LKKAKEGIYDQKTLINLNDSFKQKYFNKLENGNYQIKDFIKKRVNFKQINLLLDNFESNFDLIVCRNVVIYFDTEAKDKLYKKFGDALKKNGVLFVGSTERIFNPKDFHLISIAPFFYRKN
jgi:chemotaxis protein methyltransferase CheR